MKYKLTLYISGRTGNSQRALVNLESICSREIAGQYELNVVDVLERPQLADEAKIFATPTLVKELPHPRRKIIGDLSDTQKVLFGLDLMSERATPNKEPS